MTTTTKTQQHNGDGIGERIEDASERLTELKDEVAEKLGARVDALGTLIRNHPLAAVGIGFGVGYLLARITHR